MIVAKKFVPWPEGPTDQVVFAWFKERGISPDYVHSYAIRRDAQGNSWIEVEFIFDPDFLIEMVYPDVAIASEPEDLPKE